MARREEDRVAVDLKPEPSELEAQTQAGASGYDQIPPETPGNPISFESIQAIFDEGNRNFPEELKGQFPEQPIEEINSRYPNEWVAIKITRISREWPWIGAGRVFGHAHDWETYSKKLRILKREYPEVSLTDHHTDDFIRHEDVLGGE